MKTLLKKTFFIGIFLLFTCSYGFATNDGISYYEKDGNEILKEVNKVIAMIDIKCEQVMTVFRKDGTTRHYRLYILTYGCDKAFAEVVEPAREKGIQMLRLGKMVWRYFPGLKKSIRISGRQSFMGSDVKDNEILKLNLTEDYTAKIIEESCDEYILMLQGRNPDISYAKSIIWVRKKGFQPTRQEYFSDNGKLAKTVLYQNYKDFNGFSRPAVLEVHCASFPKRKTTLKIVSYKKDIKNRYNIFQKCNLGR